MAAGATPAIWSRLDLPAGARIEGPAILEQPDATIVIEPGLAGRVDASRQPDRGAGAMTDGSAVRHLRPAAPPSLSEMAFADWFLKSHHPPARSINSSEGGV